MIKFNLTCAQNTSLKSKCKNFINYLRTLSGYSHHHDAITFAESFRHSFSRVDDQVLCVMHLHTQIIEKVIMLLFTPSVDELASEARTKLVKHTNVLQSYTKRNIVGQCDKSGPLEVQFCRWLCKES
jgi:hypothetical protein